MPENEDVAIPPERVKEIVVHVRSASLNGPGAAFAQRVARQLMEPPRRRVAATNRAFAGLHAQMAEAARGQLEAALLQMAVDNNVRGILDRQRDAMAAITRSFTIPTVESLHVAQDAMLDVIPREPEAAQEIQQLAAEITADTEKRRVVERITGGLNRADVAGLTPWALLVLMWWFLSQYAKEPGTEVSNQLVVLVIVIAMATIIQDRK
jgi:hypothetical protein